MKSERRVTFDYKHGELTVAELFKVLVDLPANAVIRVLVTPTGKLKTLLVREEVEKP